MTASVHRRRNDTVRLAVAAVLNWILAALVTRNSWSSGATETLEAAGLFVPIAIVSSIGLVLARKQSIHSSALVAISYACVGAPLFWVFVVFLAV